MSEEISCKDKLLKHVIYEIRSFYYIYNLNCKNVCICSEDKRDNEAFSDAIFTSFLLHFRNLYYFFNNKKDIVISNFVTEKEAISNYALQYNDIDRIHRCLCHISEKRKRQTAPT